MINLTTSWQSVSSASWVPGTGFSITFYLDAKYSTQSQANNNTTIQTRLRSVINAGSGSGYNYSFTCSYAPTVSGSGLWNLATETITSGGDTITHNSDGTKTITLSGTAVISGIGMSVSLSGDAKLPDIARYPILTSAPDFTDEQNPKIVYTTSLGFTGATVQAGIFSSDGNIAYASYRNVTVSAGNYTFNLTETERNNLRSASANSNTLDVMFKIRTTAGGTNYISSLVKKMSIVSANPTIGTVTVTETNSKVVALLGSSANTLIANASVLSISIPFTIKKNATASVISAKEGTEQNVIQSYSHPNPTSPDTFSPYRVTGVTDSGKFVYIITDSRGNIGKKTDTSRTLIDYKPVDITNWSMVRESPTSSNIVLNMQAVYYQKTFGTTANVPTVQWRLGSGSWNTIPSSAWSISNNKLTITNYTLSNALVYTSEGTFTLKISDKLTEDTQGNIKVLKGIPTFEFGENDVQVNGTLYVADTTGSNAKKVVTEWISLGSKTGDTSIDLPSSFSELLCDVRLSGSNQYHITIIIPYNALTTSSRGFHQGYYNTASNNAGARINATTTTATLNAVYQNGSNILSTTIVNYYYR